MTLSSGSGCSASFYRHPYVGHVYSLLLHLEILPGDQNIYFGALLFVYIYIYIYLSEY